MLICVCVDSYLRHFGAINNKMVSKIHLFTLMQNLQSFVKPRTLDDGRWRLSITESAKKNKTKQNKTKKKQKKKKKHGCLAAAILLFIGKL